VSLVVCECVGEECEGCDLNVVRVCDSWCVSVVEEWYDLLAASSASVRVFSWEGYDRVEVLVCECV
jgi:hypothetical protein